MIDSNSEKQYMTREQVIEMIMEYAKFLWDGALYGVAQRPWGQAEQNLAREKIIARLRQLK